MENQTNKLTEIIHEEVGSKKPDFSEIDYNKVKDILSGEKKELSFSDWLKEKNLAGPISAGISAFIFGYTFLFGAPGIKQKDNINPNDYNVAGIELCVESAYAGESNFVKGKGYGPEKLPDTDNWDYLGSYDEDRDPEIPGKETKLVGYQKGDIQLIFAYFKGKDDPRSFWFFNTKTKKTFDLYADLDNDEVFEKYVAEGKAKLNYDNEDWGLE